MLKQLTSVQPGRNKLNQSKKSSRQFSSRCSNHCSHINGAESGDIRSLRSGIRRDVITRETYVLSIVRRRRGGQKEGSCRAFAYRSHSLILDCGITESAVWSTFRSVV